MRIEADGNWWKDMFDEIYLLTDARSVDDKTLTAREVDFLEDNFLSNGALPVLDLCGGQGRHALELARRGFSRLTVLDYSWYLVQRGKTQAQQEGLRTEFLQGDARDTGLKSASFNFVLIMASSFGYFPEDSENQKILQEAFRVLKPNGLLLLDLSNREYVLSNLKLHSSHQVNESISAIREREVREDIIFSRETVVSKSKGVLRSRTYCMHLYSPQKISQLLGEAGFVSVKCNKDFMSRHASGDFGSMTNRMIVTAKKDN